MKRPAFTLIELILILFIFAVVAGGATVTFSRFFVQSQLNLFADQLLFDLRRAQAHSMNGFKGSPWGVHLDESAGAFTLFKGADYDSRDVTFDQVTEMPSALFFDAVVLSEEGDQVVFELISGHALQTGSFELHENRGDFYTFTLHSLGFIQRD